MSMTIPVSAVIPCQDIDMGRPRHTLPDPRPTGNKRGPKWVIRPQVDVLIGTQTIRREKTYYSPDTVKTYKQALLWRDEICATLNHRPGVVAAQTKFSVLIDAFRLNYLPSLKPNTQETYESEIKHRIVSQFGEARLCDIDTLRIQQWANWMASKGWRAATMRQALAVFRSIWECAIDWGYTQQRCPATRRIRVSAIKAPTPRRAVTVDEVRRLRAVLVSGKRPRPELGLAVDLCAFCGLRIGEVAALQRKYLDFAAGTIAVSDGISRKGQRTSTKSTVRIVAMGGLRDDLMRACPVTAAPDTPVFPCTRSAMREAIRYGFVRAGIQQPGMGPHLLRRFYATHAKKVAALADVREAMGHADEAMTEHYITETIHEKARVTDALREHVLFAGRTGRVN